MSLRRIAQANAAIQGSPRVSDAASQISPSTPVKGNINGLPSTPRTRLVYPISPVTSPSLSASRPFDWDAARARKPAPYASPLANKQRARGRQSDTPGKAGPSKRVVRKRGLIEKITSIPSTIAFEISQFPNNVPLPTPKTSAWLLGGFCHFLHIIVRWSQTRQVPESELPWEILIREEEGASWLDWTTPATILLVLASLSNAIHLFTQTRIYQLNLAKDPVSSPNATFVPRAQTQSESDDSSSLTVLTCLFSFLRLAWRGLSVSIRFLLNLTPPKSHQTMGMGSRMERVQQLEVWTPGEMEMRLFAIYSPVHSLLWILTTSSNLAMMTVVMFLVGVQMRALTGSFELLLKDRAIISAEMLHEYDEKFVYPRINPIRKDASVMTHQAEMVHVWEDHPRRHHTPGR